jgi:1,4-dihydroxy-2-naphthoate octaprenyltransferase
LKKSEHYNPLTLKTARNLAAPHTWAAALLPALFGVFYCRQFGLALPWWKGLLLIAACVLLQSSVNTLNDYFDFIKGADSAEDHVEENDAALVYANIRPRSALTLGIAYLVAGAAAGLCSCIGKGMVPIAIGLIGGIAILIYSGGPVPVSYLPIGELVSGLVMGGLIPLGIAGCADGKLHVQILLYALPLIVGIGLIMMSNNGSDIEKDRRNGRHTLPACLGREKTRKLYRGLILIWMALVAVMPVLTPGAAGFVSVILAALFGRDIIGRQLSCTLEPADRVATMKGMIKTNLVLNGAYTASFIAGCILEVLHG